MVHDTVTTNDSKNIANDGVEKNEEVGENAVVMGENNATENVEKNTEDENPGGEVPIGSDTLPPELNGMENTGEKLSDVTDEKGVTESDGKIPNDEIPKEEVSKGSETIQTGLLGKENAGEETFNLFGSERYWGTPEAPSPLTALEIQAGTKNSPPV